MKKNVIVRIVQIVLGVAALGLAVWLVVLIASPVKFTNQVKAREAVVVERLKDIRNAQRTYRSFYQEFAGSMDELIRFIMNDTLVYRKTVGSMDDSAAMAAGLVYYDDFPVAARDTVFGTRRLSDQAIRDLRIIPFSQNKEFIMSAGFLETEAQVTVPVVECKAPYKDFLWDLDQQELVNLIDERKRLNRYPGIKFGDMQITNNEAGNWE